MISQCFLEFQGAVTVLVAGSLETCSRNDGYSS